MATIIVAKWKSGLAPAWGSLQSHNEHHRLKRPREFYVYWVEGKTETAEAGYAVRNNVVEARFYASATGTRTTCCLWISPFGSVSAMANGQGYHKASAALAAAIDKAGISLSADISGVGTAAIEQAIAAVGRLVSGTHDVVLGTSYY